MRFQLPRSRLLTLLLGAAPALVPVACKKPLPKVQAKPQQEITIETARGGRKFDDRNKTIRKHDMNRDGQPDLWKVYRTVTRDGKPVLQLVRMELDINYDGKIDIYRFYNQESDLVREEMDLDFDGKIDVTTFFENGRIVRKELSQGFDDAVRVWKHYENGRLVRAERITKRKGKLPDTFEVYLNGEIASIGYDRDGDGKPDVWQKLKEDEPITKPKASKKQATPPGAAKPPSGGKKAPPEAGKKAAPEAGKKAAPEAGKKAPPGAGKNAAPEAEKKAAPEAEKKAPPGGEEKAAPAAEKKAAPAAEKKAPPEAEKE